MDAAHGIQNATLTRYDQDLHRSIGIFGNVFITLSGVTPASSVFIIAPVALVAAGRSISCAAERRVVASLRPEPSPATSEPSKPGERSTALRITRVHEALDRAHHAGRVFGDCGDIRCGRTGWQVRYRVLERGH